MKRKVEYNSHYNIAWQYNDNSTTSGSIVTIVHITVIIFHTYDSYYVGVSLLFIIFGDFDQVPAVAAVAPRFRSP